MGDRDAAIDAEEGCAYPMKRMTAIGAGAIACGTAIALAVPATSHATQTRDRVVDRVFVECSRGSTLQVDLERERRKFEVDVEIYATPRERWTITIGKPGRVTHSVTRSANREGELNVSRYMSARAKAFEVTATSARGETCSATVRA